MKRRITFLALAIAAAAAVTVRRSDPSADDDHAVWAAVLDAHFENRGTHFVAVADSTYSFEMRRPEDEAYLRSNAAYYGNSPAMIESYIARNRHHGTVDVRRLRMAHVQVAPSGGAGRGVPVFSDHVLGLAVLSRPGYDAGGRRAIVTVAVTCGALCGHGETVQVDRGADGRWRVTRTFSTIAS